jgi:hypothetical protein
MGRHPASSRWIGKATKNDAELRGVRPEFLGGDADPVLGFDTNGGLCVWPARGESKHWWHRVNVYSEKLRTNTAQLRVILGLLSCWQHSQTAEAKQRDANR